jgi:20S proteasome alpha/beta subunit
MLFQARIALPAPQTGPQSDDPAYTITGNAIHTSYLPADATFLPAGINGGATTSTTSLTGVTTTISGSTATVTAGGIVINLVYDAAAQAAPASFKAGIQQAASILAATITDHITVNINIDYSGTGGGAAAGPDNGQYLSYTDVKNDLINNESPGDTIFNSLPAGSSVQGQTNVAVWNAQLKLWGLLGANDTTTDDGSATFATDINPGLLVGVALHELTHAMGRIPYGPAPDIFDLFRFLDVGSRLFQGSATAPAAYFSLDGGVTKLADYGQTSDSSDFLNSGVQGPNDPFNEFYSNGTSQTLSAIDLKQLDVLGFHLAINAPPPPVVIEAWGSTSLVQVGDNFYLNPVAGGNGPALKYFGTNYFVGEFGGWTPIAAEKTATGYEVAWKMAGADQYTAWNTDNNGNYVSSTLGTVSGGNPYFEGLEPSFHQDLNSDGTVGVVVSVVETHGSTSLVAMGNQYFLNPAGGGTGPALQYFGAPYYAGEFGGWTPIAAEKTATGYEVAWKMTGADQYTAWNTDNNGNYVSSIVGVVSGGNPAFEALEPSFQQDLNGDNATGVVVNVVETHGSTSLVEDGNQYFLNPVGGGTGPALQWLGAPFQQGELGGWTPIGAEKTATGYEVAWKMAGADQYTVWNTDNNGNYVSSIVGVVPGGNPSFEALETSFQQDLNGDNAVGVVTHVVETLGSTSLVEIGDQYLLNPVGGGTGPAIQWSGAPFYQGEVGGWTPIGAEKTATGYEIAWKMAGADQYTVWNADNNGNYVSSIVGVVPGGNPAFEALETSFHQDLNGDLTTGVVTSVIEALGVTSLVQMGNQYYLNPVAGGTGPALQWSGAPFYTGELGGWTPIGAEKTATGYEVAWKMAGLDQYTVWNADNNGNYVSSIVGVVSGSNPAFKALELSFQQDLNGDHTFGVVGGTQPAGVSGLSAVASTLPAVAPGPSTAAAPPAPLVAVTNDQFVFARGGDAAGGVDFTDLLRAHDFSSALTDHFGAFAGEPLPPAALHAAFDPGAAPDPMGWHQFIDHVADHFIIR